MLRKPILALLVLILSLALGAPAAAQTCTASASWVNNPTLPESVGDNESNHCDFAVFSWQSFLALTEVADPSTGQLEFETYMDVDGLFPAGGAPPKPWGQEPWPLTLDGITKQAGSGNTLLPQKPLIGRFDPVQYDMSVNKTMYDYITGNMLYTQKCFNQGGSNIHMPPTANPSSIAGSIELKTAWLPMPFGCDPAKYHCTKAKIPNVLLAVPVGLIGIHIVHKLDDHQEWIWSTFEHINNSPDCAKVTNPPQGYNNWNFYKTGFVPVNSPCPACASSDGSGCNPATQCNTFQAGVLPNICRVEPLTTVACNPKNPDLNDDSNDVACLNPSVWNLLPANSVWRNYMLVGTIWFKPGMTAPNNSGQTPPAGQQFVGNDPLSNTVMETFTQLEDANCFSCHQNQFKPFDAQSADSAETSGHADFSHIFNRIQNTDSSVSCPPLSQASHGKAASAAPDAPPVKPVRAHGSGQKK